MIVTNLITCTPERGGRSSSSFLNFRDFGKILVGAIGFFLCRSSVAVVADAASFVAVPTKGRTSKVLDSNPPRSTRRKRAASAPAATPTVAIVLAAKPPVDDYSLLLPPSLSANLLASEASVSSFANIDPNDIQLPESTAIAVFVIGLLPFLIATVEFWRRIAFGESFGTGLDSVFIGEDGAPTSSRGRRVLGKGALAVAYVLFGVSAVVLGIVLYSVVTTVPPTEQ